MLAFRARLASADLAQRQLTTLLIQLLEVIETVSRVAHDLACLRDTAQHLAELQQPTLFLVISSSVLI